MQFTINIKLKKMSKNFINELCGGFIYKEDKGNQIIINILNKNITFLLKDLTKVEISE